MDVLEHLRRHQFASRDRESHPRTYGNVAETAAVDAWALAAPACAEVVPSTLVTYLRKGAPTERAMARAIFRWVTDRIAYDEDGARGGAGIRDADAVFTCRRGICAGYASLFTMLCAAARLQATCIAGSVKDFDLAPDKQPRRSDNLPAFYRGHAWNAVKLDDRWHLVDCTYASGKRVEGEGPPVQTRPFEPGYFLIPPEQLVYTHLPDAARWQFLSEPYDRQRHAALPILHLPFFLGGLELVSHQHGVLCVPETAVVVVRAPTGITLGARLMRDGQVFSRDCVTVRRAGETTVVTASLPEDGAYSLGICVKLPAQPQQWRWAVEYKLIGRR